MIYKKLFIEDINEFTVINEGVSAENFVCAIVELRANSSPHSVPGRDRTQTQVLGQKNQFKLGLE